jgi:hypothetical protein
LIALHHPYPLWRPLLRNLSKALPKNNSGREASYSTNILSFPLNKSVG